MEPPHLRLFRSRGPEACQQEQTRVVQRRARCGPAETLETLESIRVSKTSVLINLLQMLLAILLGNLVYFLLLPHLPPAARHHLFHVDLGMMLDFWFCLVIYGLIRTMRKWQ